MHGSSLKEQIRNVVMLSFCIVLILSVVAYAFNRTFGPDFISGEGLVTRGTGDGKDSVHVQLGYGMYFDGDTVKWSLIDWSDSVVTIHSAQTISGAKTFSALITGTNGLTINAATVDFTGATVTLGTDAIQTAEIQDAQVAWAKLTSAVQDSIDKPRFQWKEDTEGTYRYGTPIRFQESTNMTITVTDHAGDSATIAFQSAGGAVWPGWHEADQTNTLDTLVFKEGYGINITQITGTNADTIHVEIDSAVMKSLLTVQDFSVLHYNANAGGIEDSVEIIWPVSGKYGAVTHSNLVRVINTSEEDAQLCTLEFDGDRPMGFVGDCDSITLDVIRTSTASTTDAYAKLIFYGMTTGGGYPDEDTVKYTGSATASASAGLPSQLSVAGGSIGPIGTGARLLAKVEVMVDPADTCDVKGRIKVWGDRTY
jgi:hypothetical protein